MSKLGKTIGKKPKSTLDIVIPVYSNFEMLEQALKVIPNAAQDITYKLYLVDDNSPDLETKGKGFYKHIRENLPNLAGILQHNKNGGFGKSCNDGANLGSSDYIMILSTDVILGENSIKIMTDHIMGSPEIGIVFPKLMFFPNSKRADRPAGRIQHAGIVFDITKTPVHIYSAWDADHPFVNRVKDYNAMTGATFIIRRKIWYQLKGFDENFGTGTYEDVDLGIRTRMLGHKIRYLPQAWGYHGVGVSSEITGNPFPMDRNKNYFIAKHNHIIPYDEWMA